MAETRRLIFDIETIGEDFDSLDPTTQEVLTRWIKRDAETGAEYERSLADLKDGLGFSPLTGEIVAIGVLDSQNGKGAVYYQAPNQAPADLEEGNFKFKALSEKEMLENFWQGAKQYDEFVSFNGRSFDVPFLAIRSAIRKVRPTKDLMSNRYLGSQRNGALHIDLQDQLCFYGAVRRKGNLHLYCRAFGIKSPKADGVSGDQVGELFAAGKFLDIARYNTGDLLATKELYDYWREYLRV